MNEGKQPTILILEDDLGVARLQQRHLERAGYSVKVTGTPAEAMAHIERNGAELLLLDYRLPGQATGLDFYAHLKTSGRDLPVILVTGFSDDATVVKALRRCSRFRHQVFGIPRLSPRSRSSRARTGSHRTATVRVERRGWPLSSIRHWMRSSRSVRTAPSACSTRQPKNCFAAPIQRPWDSRSTVSSLNSLSWRRETSTPRILARRGSMRSPCRKNCVVSVQTARSSCWRLSVTHAVVTGQPVLTLFLRDITDETGRRGKTAK